MMITGCEVTKNNRRAPHKMVNNAVKWFVFGILGQSNVQKCLKNLAVSTNLYYFATIKINKRYYSSLRHFNIRIMQLGLRKPLQRRFACSPKTLA